MVQPKKVVAKQIVLRYLKDYPLIIHRLPLSLYELLWSPRWSLNYGQYQVRRLISNYVRIYVPAGYLLSGRGLYHFGLMGKWRSYIPILLLNLIFGVNSSNIVDKNTLESLKIPLALLSPSPSQAASLLNHCD